MSNINFLFLFSSTIFSLRCFKVSSFSIDSLFCILPVFPIIFSLAISLIASIIPLPHIPLGCLFPITFFSISSPIFIFSIAPSPALIPQLIFIPSNAGPAAHEHDVRFDFLDKTISPFVPISINKIFLSVFYKLQTQTPATISAPM
ncbi:hypothetical protein SDC9_178684 [bioreactor metagenome]|uniref:Uncharacterized protein n=1 Tax=bioreactor metagenome TaxID=1076179 RepID=A0A645GXU7_9ZZZZ